MVQACLGVSIQGTHNRVLFDRPYLPQGIPQLWIKGLRSGKGSVDIWLKVEMMPCELRLWTNKARSK